MIAGHFIQRVSVSRWIRPAHPGYASIRVHDLKHTFGRRLRAAGVTQEDRKALLGHKNGSITSHYSGAELGHLIEAANMVSATDRSEEHTSELQSLMRISYAVFCLKK